MLDVTITPNGGGGGDVASCLHPPRNILNDLMGTAFGKKKKSQKGPEGKGEGYEVLL
jgi:hypothetical protein